ncbi:hypothetical protein [Clostridium sporogenes]|uniref:hypothetical protein n=1 Tax=Clostridium sporogenes TaxID=1509 RepID=UPI0022384851|nr:hypothetical protein [Clostridium sporogenes]MCW6110088.1 hypothetical protein [Clostridium sporogenes]
MLTTEELKRARIESFKIIKQVYGKSSYNSNKIYFSCASNYAQIKNKGQGDIEEGLYARVHKDNHKYIDEQIKKYGSDLLQISNGDFVDLKLKSVMNMPVFCLFSIKGDNQCVSFKEMPAYFLKKPRIIHKYIFKINKKIFLDFIVDEDGKVKDKPSILAYLSLDKLLKEIKNSFLYLGYDSEEIINRDINYINRTNCEWFCPEDHPYELFYKSKEDFKYQHEHRIIIRDRNVNLIDREKDKVFLLHLPNLKNFTRYSDMKSYGQCEISVITKDVSPSVMDKDVIKSFIVEDAIERYKITGDKLYYDIANLAK